MNMDVREIELNDPPEWGKGDGRPSNKKLLVRLLEAE